MTAAEFISYVLQFSLALGAFCAALQAPPQVLRWLFQRPGLLGRTLLAMYLIMPALTLSMARYLDLERGLEIGMATLMLSPVPPILPARQIKAGGSSYYVLSLLAITAALSVVLVPLSVRLLGHALDRPMEMAVGPVFRIVATSLLVPVILGVLFRRFWPDVALRIAKPLALVANLLMAAAFVPVMLKLWPTIVGLIGNFTLVAIAFVVAVGLAVGHLLGGPEEEDRTVLALATATRHPAMAVAIAHVAAPHQHTTAAAVILYLVAGSVFCIPYVKWRRRRSAALAVA